MVPIYEQGEGHGIGHSYDSFIMRFKEICRGHLQVRKAKAFAMLFYDFNNHRLKRYLKDEGFTTLDRLLGKELSVFYLHSTTSEDLIQAYNNSFKEMWEIDEHITPPFMLFIKFDQNINEVVDFQCVILEKYDSEVGFKELYDIIENYKKGITDIETPVIKTKVNKVVNFLRDATINVGLERIIEGFFNRVQ